jgi:hypothetical protein
MCFEMTPETPTTEVRTVRPVAPEDLAPGMYICALAAAANAWPDIDCAREGATVRAARVVYIPQDGGVPVRVRSVCLPFVLAETFDGRAQVLDIRMLRIARVRKKHARAVFAALQKNRTLDGGSSSSGSDDASS